MTASTLQYGPQVLTIEEGKQKEQYFSVVKRVASLAYFIFFSSF
jgi:hypothetical protein